MEILIWMILGQQPLFCSTVTMFFVPFIFFPFHDVFWCFGSATNGWINDFLDGRAHAWSLVIWHRDRRDWIR